MSLGAIVVACNDRWTQEELAYAIGDSEPALLICDRPDPGLGVRVLDMHGLLADPTPAELPDTPVAEDDPALILYTSGTTGRPKGALISHRGLIGFVDVNACNLAVGLAMARRFGVDLHPEPGRILLTAPMFHVSGLFAGIILAAAGGDTLVLRVGRFDAHDVLRIIERERVTQWTPLGAMGPRVLEALAEKNYDVSSVRQLGFGGAPLSPTLRRRLMDAFPNNGGRSGMGYGSSETVSVVTSIGGPEFDEHPTSAGRVLPTVSMEIRDGEIHVRSAYLMLGYWKNGQATAETIKPGRWLATGDVGHVEDGLLYIDSRARDMILRSGENVYPIEVEHRLGAHPAVAEAAVVGVDHDVLGQEVKAVIVPAPGATVDPVELAAWTPRYSPPTRCPRSGRCAPRHCPATPRARCSSSSCSDDSIDDTVTAVAVLSGRGVWSFELRYSEPAEASDAAAELESLGYTAAWLPDVGGDLFPALENLLPRHVDDDDRLGHPERLVPPRRRT